MQFLSPQDAGRAARTLDKLARHEIHAWALTGGFAVEIHDPRPVARKLQDIDFVAPDFRSIPASLAADFLFRHVHPDGPAGKTMVQFVDPETALRVDVFGACGATLKRATTVVSPADMLARSARLVLDLAVGDPVPAKHVNDYRSLVEWVPAEEAEIAWPDHRKPRHPATFAGARAMLQDLIPARPDLLVTPRYSQDPTEICPRCVADTVFPLADPKLVLALLGYC